MNNTTVYVGMDVHKESFTLSTSIYQRLRQFPSDNLEWYHGNVG